MKLYYGPRTRSTRALWMLEEVGADCEIEVIDIMSGGGTSDAFRKLNPMGKAPVLVDEGQVIADSVAICAHLAEKYPEAGLAPKPGTPERGRYYHWLMFHGSTLEPAFIQKACGWESDKTGMIAWGDPDRTFAALKASLPAEGWLAGDRFSAADLLIGGTLAFLKPSGMVEMWPEADAFIARCTERPGFAKAQTRDEALAKQLEG